MSLVQSFLRPVLASLLLGLSTLSWAADIEVSDVFIREAPPKAAVSAAYMKISNTGSEEQHVVAVSSPDFKRVEIHEMIDQDGVAKMQQVERLTIPAEKSVSLEPGGLHIMLYEPQRALKAGDTSKLTLSFANEFEFDVDVPVKKMKHADNHNHEHHHHHH